MIAKDSVRRRQFHVPGVIQNAAAVWADHDFLLRAAMNEYLRRQFHVAAAAHPALHANYDIAALAFEEPFVARPRRFVHRRRQFVAAGLQGGQFFFQILLAPIQLRELLVHPFFGLGGFGHQAGDFFLRGFGLFHQFDFAVFNFRDFGFAIFDFAGQRAVFLVFTGLELLVGVFFNLRLLGFDFEFKPFAFGFDLFDAIFGGFELCLG